MVTDRQVRRLFKLLQEEKTLELAAAKSGMDEKTARKYRDLGKLPSEVKKERDWRTRPDPFEDVWDDVVDFLKVNRRLEAKSLFFWLQQEYPGRFPDGQLRTLQRRVKHWRATAGPAKEVYFQQKHEPGKLCQSDFTHMNQLGITIAGQPFDHLIYHFVLTYSNWEAGTICFSESFESLSEGLQNALWELGGVPLDHQTDRLSTAVHNMDHPEEFTRRYQELLDHYGLRGRKIQAGKAHENGDIEQRHYRFKQAVDQALMLRGSRDFSSRELYEAFLAMIFRQLNAGRVNRFQEELAVLRRLPDRRLDSYKRVTVKVRSGSTIRVQDNVYSVHSRLIGETVEVRVYAEYLEIWYGQKQVDRLPRLRGKKKHRIIYRHIIDWLVRKPGAFANYRYRDDLFPGVRFRVAYDRLQDQCPQRASKEYLGILQLAAQDGEAGVDEALRLLIEMNWPITKQSVQLILESERRHELVYEVKVVDVELSGYDQLLSDGEAI